jgi:hypothetical protein
LGIITHGPDNVDTASRVASVILEHYCI